MKLDHQVATWGSAVLIVNELSRAYPDSVVTWIKVPFGDEDSEYKDRKHVVALIVRMAEDIIELDNNIVHDAFNAAYASFKTPTEYQVKLEKSRIMSNIYPGPFISDKLRLEIRLNGWKTPFQSENQE